MALWFVSYATSPITVTIHDASIVIVYDVTLLLSMTYHFQSRLGKTDCKDIMGNKTEKPSIVIYRISGSPLCVVISPSNGSMVYYSKWTHLILLMSHVLMDGWVGAGVVTPLPVAAI